MKRSTFYLILLILVILPIVACQSNNDNDNDGREINQDFVTGIRNALPMSWEMTVLNETGSMEPPHGLEEPIFRIDFVDSVHEFEFVEDRNISPSLRLYFYDINDKDSITKVIKLQEMYSWDVPVLFDETAEYIIVTSPVYINGGYYSDEAMTLYRPLEKVLKEYFKLQK